MIVKQAISIAICLLLFLVTGLAQENQPTQDTVLLKEVQVWGLSLQKYTAGNKVETIDQISRDQFQSSSLSDLLQQITPLYLKSYGNSMLSTPSFRGTSASHTAVIWNGININSSSLGQSDFSIIPVFSIDNVSVHHGGGSSLFGSDAIGGTIELTTSPDYGDGWEGEFQQDIGSFNNYFTSISVKRGSKNLGFRTGVFHRFLENNFPFVNTTRFNNPRERQNNASVQQWGLTQDFNLKMGSQNYLTFNSWVNFSDREVQPTMTNAQGKDRQEDKNFRSALNYHLFTSLGYSNIRAGYIYDLIDFNGSISVIDRTNTSFQHEFDFSNQLNIRFGGDWNHIIADVPGHGKPIKEDRNDLFILSRYNPTKRLLLSLNLRKPFVSGFKTPIAPSLGTEYLLVQRANQMLAWKINISKNYRVPTLNDRFWSPGGNKDIQSELSFNIDNGLVYQSKKNFLTTETELTIYRNRVDNWIIWLPKENFWSPENIKKVNAQGIELAHKSTFRIGETEVQSGLSYLFSRTVSIESDLKEEVGKQLPYTPMHSGNLHGRIFYKNWSLNPILNYTGKRYTTSFEDRQLESYALVDVWLGKCLKWGDQSINLTFRVNNLTNKVYQNYEYRAMPGRNYNVSMRLNLNRP